MFWQISKFIAILIFLASAIQLYREQNIGYLIIALGSFASLMTWLKGEVVVAAEKLNDPNMKVIEDSIKSLKTINNWGSRWELARAMRFHKNPDVRRKATAALIELKDKRAMKGAVSHLPHPEILIALSSMDEIENEQIKKALFRALRDLFKKIGTSAELSVEWRLSMIVVIRAIGKTKDKDIVKPLLSLFELIEGTLGFDEIEKEIIDALGIIGGRYSRDFLMKLFKGEWVPSGAKNAQARPRIGGRYYKHDENVQAALRKLLTDSSFERLVEIAGNRMGLKDDQRRSSSGISSHP